MIDIAIKDKFFIFSQPSDITMFNSKLYCVYLVQTLYTYTKVLQDKTRKNFRYTLKLSVHKEYI